MNMPQKVSPLRSKQSRFEFCQQYFNSVGAELQYHDDDYLEYKLPQDVDKEMTERPYYWIWVEKTGQEPKPSIMRLAFSDVAEARENKRIRDAAIEEAGPYLTDLQKQYFVAPKSEFVTLGSFRLDKIYASLDNRGKFASVMPANAYANTPLVPWLVVNLRVSYCSDITEQQLLSYGICLQNGQRIQNFYDMIRNIAMKPMNPSVVASRMKLDIREAIAELKSNLEMQMNGQPHRWALDAKNRLKRDIEQLNTYYDSLKPQLAEDQVDAVELERTRKLQDLMNRSTPRVEIETLQVALVGLIEKAR